MAIPSETGWERMNAQRGLQSGIQRAYENAFGSIGSQPGSTATGSHPLFQHQQYAVTREMLEDSEYTIDGMPTWIVEDPATERGDVTWIGTPLTNESDARTDILAEFKKLKEEVEELRNVIRNASFGDSLLYKYNRG